VILFIATATVGLYVILYNLAWLRIDPTIYVPAEPRQYHATMVLSPLGIVVWTVVIAIHSFVIALVASLYLKQRLLFLASILFVASLVIVIIVHPTFLPMALPQILRQSYLAFVEKYIPALYKIYLHWGIGKYIYLIFAIHTSFLSSLLLLSQRVSKLKTNIP
jgi:hypothetical protein